MKASLIYWHKARVKEHYVLEMAIHKIGKTAQYPDGVKYGLIFIDLKSKDRVLMDNHHPKGAHIHVNAQEIAYEYVNEEKLIEDFKGLVLANMGVKI